MKKDLHVFVAHIDDFEFSCLGYVWKKRDEYENIFINTATLWTPKVEVWDQNLKKICNSLSQNEIFSRNFLFEQRTLMTNFDALKDEFYKTIDFQRRFDIMTHDNEDCHTDHVACNMIANGLYKYANKFITVYSPSSKNFKANFWIGLPNDIYHLKKSCVDKYNIKNEQSYTKLGYYINSEEHYNLGRAYFLENFVNQDFEHYEVYRMIKSVE